MANDKHDKIAALTHVLDEREVWVTRDYGVVEIPAVALDLDGIAVLRDALDCAEEEIRGYLEREAAEREDSA